MSDELPTLAELAARAAGATAEMGGLRCPKCGWSSCPVLYGQHEKDSPAKWRKRKCRRCGHEFMTLERVMGDAAKESKPQGASVHARDRTLPADEQKFDGQVGEEFDDGCVDVAFEPPDFQEELPEESPTPVRRRTVSKPGTKSLRRRRVNGRSASDAEE